MYMWGQPPSAVQRPRFIGPQRVREGQGFSRSWKNSEKVAASAVPYSPKNAGFSP